MGELFSLVAALALGVVRLLSGIWDFMVKAWNGWVVACIIVFTLFWQFITHFVDLVKMVVGLVGQLQSAGGVPGVGAGAIGGPLRDAFDLVNAVFPLTELCGSVTFLIGLWMICVTIRLIKGWIPTLA